METEEISKQELLEKYRRIMNSVHAHGNIFYDAGRMHSYVIFAKLASNTRREP